MSDAVTEMLISNASNLGQFYLYNAVVNLANSPSSRLSQLKGLGDVYYPGRWRTQAIQPTGTEAGRHSPKILSDHRYIIGEEKRSFSFAFIQREHFFV